MKSWKRLLAAVCLAAGIVLSPEAARAVVDESPPTITCPGNIQTTAVFGEPDAIVFFEVQVSDAGGGAVQLGCTYESGSRFPVGTTTVVCVAQDDAGNSSQCEFQVTVEAGTAPDPGNVVWPRALTVSLVDELGVLRANASQALQELDQSRWYRFAVRPASRVVVTLTQLPANYDLALFTDIGKAYRELTAPEDLPRVDAEFADDAFSPAQFSPAQFSPAQFSPAAFSPAQFSPAQFSPAQFSPAQFSPAQFSPAQFSPDTFSPAQFSPAQFSPAQFSPAQFSPAQFSPAQFSANQFDEGAYAGAQVRSVIAVSAFDGTADEGVVGNTWNEDTYFYVRVRGRQGAFAPGADFRLDVYLFPGPCQTLKLVPEDGAGQPLPPSTVAAPPGGYRTLILTDYDRLVGAGPSVARSELSARLQALADRPEVHGYVIDVGPDPWVAFFNAQADSATECPYAKNLVAEAIRGIVERSRNGNALEYVVLAGADAVVPFFRHPDEAMLGPEEQYLPPVREFSASQAALRRNYFLSQDRYGARCEVARKGKSLPLPDLAVGRLVETADEIAGMVDAYLGTSDGVLPPPTSVLVTGYDFLEDAANAVAVELQAGTGVEPDRLIAPASLAPDSPDSWTADDLRQVLLGARHDIVFLAGHFSAAGALAADYRSALFSAELLIPGLDLENSLFYSAGCHSGYNIVDADAVPGVTLGPDWAQVMARKRATLVAGTGYQYGDTDFLEYSERLYLGFTRRLRTGPGPVPVGKALAAAKREYLASTADLRGIHEKALLEATLFGLPMLSVNMPAAGRLPAPVDTSIVVATHAYTAVPPADPTAGEVLKLRYADVIVDAALTRHQMQLKNAERDPLDPNDPAEVTAVWYSGASGVAANPAEPVLPLEIRNVHVPDFALRGVGLRRAEYVDEPQVVALTGAATTEIRGVHPAFLSDVFFPPKYWRANYYGDLCGTDGAGTRLMVTPAQFRSEPGADEGTLRRYPRTEYRLFYSSNILTYVDAGTGMSSTPAQSGPPSISQVNATVAGTKAHFSMQVVGNPAAGVQEVWVTYTAVQGPLAGRWDSLDLVQNGTDSRVWEGELELGATSPDDVRFQVQAVNGVGLVALASNLGAYYIPGQTGIPAPGAGTTVELLGPPAQVPYGTRTQLRARLAAAGTPLSGRTLTFRLGGLEARGVTGADGSATVQLNVLLAPGPQALRAVYGGAADFGSSAAQAEVEVQKGATTLVLEPSTARVAPLATETLRAVVTDGTGRPVTEQTVVFVVSGPGGTQVKTAITDPAGGAALGAVVLPDGSYSVRASFGEVVNPGAGYSPVGSVNALYGSSSATGTLILDPGVPTAVDDEVTGRAGLPLKIAISTLLGNDSDSDGVVLSLDSADAATGQAVPVTRSGSWLLLGPLPAGVNSDAFRYRVADADGKTAEARVVIRIEPDQAPTSNILGLTIEGGMVRLTFGGIPGRIYRVQFSPAVSPPVWQGIGTALIGPDGLATFVAPDLGGGSGFYRTAYP